MELIGRQLGRYLVVDRLGAGGMGEAYRAHDSRLDRDVALKVLPAGLTADEAARRQLRREALALSRLNHPSIAVVHDFDTVDGIDLLVMELVDGEPLAAVISRRGRLPVSQAVAYAREIAEAVGAAHAANVVHRDLNPANILVTRDGRIKVIDFGLARSFEGGDTTAVTRMATHAPTAAGTVPYMPPEQLEGESIDARADVYALGAVLYEMVTGARPFPETGLGQVVAAILTRDPVSPRSVAADVPPSIEQLILRCLAKDPAARPQSARDVIAALAHVDAPAAAPVEPVSAESIVALPARVFGSEADAFLAEAIPNTLTTELVRRGGLDVKSPPTAEEVARINGDIVRVAAAYAVASCIAVVVTATGRSLTLDVQLVAAPSRRIRWADQYRGTRAKYLALVRAAAIAIRQQFDLPSPPPPATAAAGTRSGIELDLQRAIYHAKRFVNGGHAADLERAQVGFEAVLAADAGSVAALEWLAIVQLARVVFGSSTADVAPLVESHARRALAIDPRAARAWSALGEVQPLTPEGYRLRLEYGLRGAVLAPADYFPHARLAAPLFFASAHLAREATSEAARLDPLAVTAHLYDAIANMAVGDAERSIRSIDAALALDPDAPFSRYARVLALVGAGRDEEAGVEAEALEPLAAAGRLHPEWARFAGAIARARRALAAGGAAAEEMTAYLTAVANGRIAFPRWQSTTSGVARLLARYGRPEEAVNLLMARHEAGVREPLDLLVLDPALAELPGDPRYAALVADAAAQFTVMVDVATGARARGEMPAYIGRALDELLKRAPIAGALAAAGSRAATGGS